LLRDQSRFAARSWLGGGVVFHHEKAAEVIETFAREVSGLPLLRIYWYDGTSTGPSSQHLALAHLPRVKVRLGFVNSVGEQKGVDSLIVTDMIALARNRAMTDAVLLSGDEDLRVGVQQAQELGVRIHLLGIKPSRGSQSLFLLQEADTTHEWDVSDLRSFLAIREAPAPAPAPAPAAPASGQPAVPAAPPADNPLTAVAELLARSIPETELPTLVVGIRAGGQIPRDIDSRLLAKSRARLKIDLTPPQKRELRAAFLQICEARLASITP
jgi:hypothetical protein